jgi:hypothetical protein
MWGRLDTYNPARREIREALEHLIGRPDRKEARR